MNDVLNIKVKSAVNKYGIGHTIKLFDGSFDVIKRAYQDNPSEYLNQFNDLKIVERDKIIFYVDKNGIPLFYYKPDEKNGYVYINYNRIWVFFSNVIGFKFIEIQGIINNWLSQTYNLRGLTPYYTGNYQ